MKITINRSVLLERLANVAKAISSKFTIPILEGILIESHKTLRLTGTDTILSISSVVDDYVEHESGAAVIPAKKLLEVIKKLPEKPISIETSETTALIKCGSTKVKLPVMDPEEYPKKAYHFDESNAFAMDGDEFTDLIVGTKFSASTAEQTPILCGINFEVNTFGLTAIATDRHRLAKRYVQATDHWVTSNISKVVPIKVLELVVQLKPQRIDMELRDDSVCIKAGGYEITSSLLDGSYPDTSKIIPTSAPIEVLVNREQLLKALELAEKVTEEKTKIVRLDVNESEVFVSVVGHDVGMEESLEAEVSGGEIKIAANAEYLVNALKPISSARVRIQLTGPMSPVIIKGENDESALYLVLPYRVPS